MLNISLKDTSIHISINSKYLYLSLECFLNFLSNVDIPPCVRKIVKFKEFTFLENALSRDVFTHAPSQSNLAPNFLSSRPIGRRELLISRGSVLSKICFPHKQKGVEKITICFTKIQSEKIKMTSNIRIFIFCTICNSFKCDGYTVL